MGKQWKQWQTLFWGAPKSLQMVTADMKLKDTPWKESYDQPRQHIKKQRHYLPTNVHLVKAMFFPVVMHACESWTKKKAEHRRTDAFDCGVKDSLLSFGLQGDPTSPSYRSSVLRVHWKEWYWSWNCNTLATWCEELIHWKGPRFWERLKAGGDWDNRG